jgi:thioredoxin 2
MNTKQRETARIRCTSCGSVNRVPVKRLKENPLCGNCKRLLDFPMSAIRVTEASFDKEMSEWPESLLIYTWSKSCESCRAVESVVDDIAFLRAGRVKVLKIDIDAEPSLARMLAVQAPPAFLVFRNRAQVSRLDGVPREKIELLQWIEQQLTSE